MIELPLFIYHLKVNVKSMTSHFEQVRMFSGKLKKKRKRKPHKLHKKKMVWLDGQKLGMNVESVNSTDK